jgi:hypothetical protein
MKKMECMCITCEWVGWETLWGTYSLGERGFKRKGLTMAGRLVTDLSPRTSGLSMCDLWWTKCHWDRFFSESFGCPLPVSFHRGCTYSCIVWMMNSRPASGRSSETRSQSPDMNKLLRLWRSGPARAGVTLWEAASAFHKDKKCLQ